MELSLLREENARLKVERHRPPDAGRVIERMRHLGGHAEERGESAELGEPSARTPQAARAMEECLAIRDGLVLACQEVQQAMQGIRGRLGALSVDLQDGAHEHPRRPAPAPVAVAEELDGELAVEAPVASSLAQNAA